MGNFIHKSAVLIQKNAFKVLGMWAHRRSPLLSPRGSPTGSDSRSQSLMVGDDFGDEVKHEHAEADDLQKNLIDILECDLCKKSGSNILIDLTGYHPKRISELQDELNISLLGAFPDGGAFVCRKKGRKADDCVWVGDPDGNYASRSD